MAMEIIDGHAGKPHINGEDLTALNIGTFGEGDYVLSFGDGLEATMTTSNQVTIGAGALVHAGRRSVNLSAQSLTVQSGTQGQKRNDLVVSRYSAVPSGSDTIESEDLVVIKGTPVSYGEAADPEITDNDMPLWRIPIDGITPGTPVQLFEVMKPMSELWDSVSQRIVSVADDRFVLLSGQVTERTLTVSDSDGFVIGSVLSISTGNDNVHPLGFAVDGDTITVKIVNIHSEGVWAQPRVTVSLRRS